MMSKFRLAPCLVFCGISLAASALVGCGTPGPVYKARVNRALRVQETIKKDQEASLAEPGPNTIRGESSKVFVGNRRWMIVPKTDVTESDGNRIVSIGLTEFGTATALTEDGYFLTAAHVVQKGAPVAVNKMDIRPARIVKLLPSADLALIKFPFKVKWSFDRLASSVEGGDQVFSDAAKGTVRERGMSQWGDGLRSIECTLPSAPGQSGGPVVNAEGELVGVLVGVYQIRLTRRITDKAVVRMVEPEVLLKLIEDDRRDSAG